MISEKGKDIVRRAEEFYDSHLRADLERNHLHEFVAIEPDSGEHFLGKSSKEAAIKARQAQPGKQAFVIQIGHKAAVHIGNWS